MKRRRNFWRDELARVTPTNKTKEQIAEEYGTNVQNLTQIFKRYDIRAGRDYARKPIPNAWSAYEQQAIKRYYAWRGAKWLVQHLKDRGYNRTRSAVHVYATKHMIDGYAPNGYVCIHDTHCNGPSSSIGKQAQRDGVLRRACKAWVVPEDWYDNYIEEEMELIEHANQYSDWVTLKDIARSKRVAESTLRSQWKRNVDLGAKLNEIPHETIYYPVKTYKWHPDALRL